jgi:hypothetical protein
MLLEKEVQCDVVCGVDAASWSCLARCFGNPARDPPLISFAECLRLNLKDNSMMLP